MTVMNSLCAFGFLLRIETEKDDDNLPPVGAFGRGIEQAQIELYVLAVIVRQHVTLRRLVQELDLCHRFPQNRHNYIGRTGERYGYFHSDENDTLPSSGSRRYLSTEASLGGTVCYLDFRPVENTPWKNSLQDHVFSGMDIRDVLARNLKRHRLAKGLSQEELAHRANIDRTYISSLERSVYAAGIDVVDRLAKELGLEAADLLRCTEPASRDASNADEKEEG